MNVKSIQNQCRENPTFEAYYSINLKEISKQGLNPKEVVSTIKARMGDGLLRKTYLHNKKLLYQDVFVASNPNECFITTGNDYNFRRNNENKAASKINQVDKEILKALLKTLKHLGIKNPKEILEINANTGSIIKTNHGRDVSIRIAKNSVTSELQHYQKQPDETFNYINTD